MFYLKHAAIVAAGVAALAACTQQAPPAPEAPTAPVADTAADEAAIRAINPAWFAAYNSGDAAAVAALYAEDAVVSPPDTAALRGSAAIREFFVKEIAGSSAAGLDFRAGASPEFGVSGDLGWEWNTFTVTDASGAAVDTGKYTTLYGRVDGQWRIIRDIWNSDVRPAAPAPAAEAVPE
jgi:uncharacterized protein (TIGR02246 family)